MMDVGDRADRALVDQPLRGGGDREPAQRPVDRQQFARFGHGRRHRIGLGERGGEGLLHQDVHAVLGHAAGPFAMRGGGGAEDHEIGLRLFQARAVVGENAVCRQAEIARRLLHPLRLLIADADDLRLRMLGGIRSRSPMWKWSKLIPTMRKRLLMERCWEAVFDRSRRESRGAPRARPWRRRLFEGGHWKHLVLTTFPPRRDYGLLSRKGYPEIGPFVRPANA